MKNKDHELDELEKLLGKEEFDEMLDRLESDFEKEFGNALRQQTETLRERISAAKG
jgi:hypothetical protein